MILGKSMYHVVQDEGKCYSKDGISGYYNDLTNKILQYPFQRGIIPYMDVEDGRRIEFSVGIFQYGLAAYDLYLLNNDFEMLDVASMCAGWALEHQLPNGGWDTLGWLYKEYPYSAMAQGEAISLLSRIYLQRPDEKIMEAIVRAKDFMLSPLESGGVTEYHKSGEIYFYERTNLSVILNGNIFAIWGLWDYCKLVDTDFYAKQILENSINTLAENLDKWDTGYWSKYSLKEMIASPFYHRLHIAQLKVMYDLTNKDEFLFYAKKWERYANNPVYKCKSFITKAYQKLKE